MSTTRAKPKPLGATMKVKWASSPPASPASAAPSTSMASLYWVEGIPMVRAAGSSSRMASSAKPHFDPRRRAKAKRTRATARAIIQSDVFWGMATIPCAPST
jgi:hypothetical protein